MVATSTLLPPGLFGKIRLLLFLLDCPLSKLVCSVQVWYLGVSVIILYLAIGGKSIPVLVAGSICIRHGI